MRSRYSAFAIGDTSYLLDTWHPTTRPLELDLDPSLHWYRLDILAVARGGVLDTTGNVEFRAYYRSPAGPGEQHELSRFVKQDNGWFYLDGAA
jgi:SEC-C motif-containing protein